MSLWPEALALLRIGPDTTHLADHIQITATGHPRGCLCPECSDLRRAVGGGRSMNKHIAAAMTARERGKRAAEAEIIAQRKREAAARAEVTRELAYWGAYPYRASDGGLGGAEPVLATGAGDCTCGPPYGSYHLTGCPGGIEVPSLGGAAVMIEGEPAEPADPVAQWREVTRSLVLPDYGQRIATIPDQPPGTCINCRTGPLFSGNQCWYCNALDDLRLGQSRLDQAERSRERAVQVTTILCLLLAAVVFWLGLYLIWTGALTP